MAYQHDCSDDERGMLHDLINLLLERIDTQRRLNEDLSRRLESERERMKLLEAAAYGFF
jgi:hypothetical protein